MFCAPSLGGENSGFILAICSFPYTPPPAHPDKPPGRRVTPRELDFGPFRVRFGPVSSPFQGVGWGRGEGLL